MTPKLLGLRGRFGRALGGMEEDTKQISFIPPSRLPAGESLFKRGSSAGRGHQHSTQGLLLLRPSASVNSADVANWSISPCSR